MNTNAGKASSHEQDAKSDSVILFLSFSILAACIWKLVFSKLLKNKIPLPITVFVLLLGFIIGVIIKKVNRIDNNFVYGEIALSEINPHLMHYIFLPLLIFDSSFNGHFHVIKQQLLSAILLAGPGVLITTIIIALCAIYMFPYNWSWLTGLMFGSILSATDTMIVVTLLHEHCANRSLAALIDSESLLNDASAFVLFLIFYNLISSDHHGPKEIIIDIIKFCVAGPAFGLICGIISVFILNHINNDPEIEITFTFGIAYLVFYVADIELGVSAVLAVITMGLYMSKYKYCISSNVQSSMASAWQITTFFINILVFTITGIILARSFLGITTGITAKDFGFSIVLYVIIHVGRILTIVIFYPFMRWTDVDLSWKECILLSWSGLRGSMSLVLVLIVSLDHGIDSAIRDRFLFHVSIIVLTTLVINGTTTKYFVKILGLNRGTKESEAVILQALEHIRRDTSQRLIEMKQDDQYADVDWDLLNNFLPDKLLEELDKQNNTNFHQQLSRQINDDLTTIRISSIDYELKPIPPVYQTHSISVTPVKRQLGLPKIQKPIVSIDSKENMDNQQDINIRNELITRILSAMAVDYEKQWSLGMVRRQTLNVLMKSVERAKEKCSLNLHWSIILHHFRMPLLLRILIKLDYFNLLNQLKSLLFFHHIFRTMELTLSFHLAKTRVDNIRSEFPELIKLNERIADEIYEQAKLYQLNAMNILLDLQESYRSCWTIQMTRRCAQMLLKYQLMIINHLQDTGVLAEFEYSRISHLIENKLFSLEYGRLKMDKHEKSKILDDSFDLIPYFQSLSLLEKHRWKLALKSEHKWFDPDTVLLQKDQHISNAYLIVRGIVQCKNNSNSTYFKCGTIIGIDGLFSSKYVSNGTYCAHGGLVETYAINSNILNGLLSDKDASRSFYDEIAFHIIVNNYKGSLNLTHAKIKTLLDERVQFYRDESNINISLNEDDKLFLLDGTLTQLSNDGSKTISSICFIQHQYPITYKLDSSAIVYTWTSQDESYCANERKYKISFSSGNDQATTTVEPFYPAYLDVSIELNQQYRSASVGRATENSNRAKLPSQRIAVADKPDELHQFEKL